MAAMLAVAKELQE
jgi:hypothetical protein